MKNTINWRFGIVLAAAAALFAGSMALNLPAGEPALAEEKMKQGELLKDVAALHASGDFKDMVIGKKDAPVTIVEYSSLTCGHCGNFHKNVLPELKSKYIDTGKVRYISRGFLFGNLDIAGFMLARCKDGKYQEISDDLFTHQEEWAFVQKPASPFSKMKERVKKFGHTDETILACLRDQGLMDKLVKVSEKARTDFHVSSTPTLFVNGKLLRGASHIRQIEELMGVKAK